MIKGLLFRISWALVGIFSCHLLTAQTATWVGSISSDWDNTSNWIWSNGAIGIPGDNTDVIINPQGSNSFYPIIENTTAHCKNLTFMSSVIQMKEGSALEVYGSITVEVVNNNIASGINGWGDNSEVVKNSVVSFLGSNEQLVQEIYCAVDKIIINKTAGNVRIGIDATINEINSLDFRSLPVAIGQEPAGNLILESNGRLSLYHINTISLPSYTSTEIPPHIISPLVPDYQNNMGNIVLDFPTYASSPSPDSFWLPMGATPKSFDPVSISNNHYTWIIAVTRGLPAPCSESSFIADNAVQNTYYISPVDTEFGLPILSPLEESPTISLGFNNTNINEDVPPNFNEENNTISLWRLDNENCYYQISDAAEHVNGGYISVAASLQAGFPKFVLSPQAGGSTVITEVEKEAGFTIYPNPACESLFLSFVKQPQDVNVTIMDALGRCLIEREFKANTLQVPQPISLLHIASGMYFINVKGKHFDFSKKFSKQ